MMDICPIEDLTEDPPPMPEGLQAAGQKAWQEFTGPDGWDFDAAALITLEQFCRSLDLEARLQVQVDKAERLRCKGSRDNYVEIPELGSLVKVRAQTAQLQARLKLDDDADDAADDPFVGMSATSAKARKAARSRWDRRFA